MIERKKRQISWRAESVFFVCWPPGDCVVGSGLFENVMCEK